ncbi:MAG: homoserine kinase [Rhodospirillales bacterium]|nr:MAG: homoserine kinase [Rhodospirillales bacterium]
MAVYTEVTDEEVAAFVADYAIGAVVACKGIAEGVENSNFLLATDRGTFILTLYERRVRPEDLPFFLGLMEHLAAAGVPCPVPVRAQDGTALRMLAGRPAAIVTFLRGLWPKRPTPHHCSGVGEALAALHLAGLDFPCGRSNDLSVQGWRALLEACVSHGDRFAADLADDLAEELTAELAALETAWPQQLPAGIIHADLFPDNVFFERDRLSGVIDFYFACRDFLAYDLAICLNAWCFEPDGSFNITKARRLLTAYHARRPLTASELAALPLLARGAAMRFLLTRLYDWLNTPRNALVSPKNPAEYLQKLRFHRRIRGPEGYGLGRP